MSGPSMMGPVSKRGGVEKVYRDKLVPPTKAVIREVKGGHKRWTNSRPQLVMQQEEADAYWRGHLKAGSKPRFPKSKNAAGYDPKNRRYYDPETVRFGAHLGDPNTYNDFQRVNQFGRGVSKGYKLKAFPPQKENLRVAMGGGRKASSFSVPATMLEDSAMEAAGRAKHRMSDMPRTAAGAARAAMSPARKPVVPNGQNFNARITNPYHIWNSQTAGPGGRVSKTFFPGAGKVTPDKGYVPAAMSATSISAPGRAKRLKELRRGQLKSYKQARARAGKKPLYSRGDTGRVYEENNMVLGHLNDAPARQSATRKKVRYAHGVTEEQQAKIEANLPKKTKRPVTFHNSEHAIGGLPRGLGGVTFGRTGKRKPAHVLVPENAGPHVIRHEYEHSQPKRTFGRVSNLQANSKLRGREEGRADVPAIRHTGMKRTAFTQYEQHAELNREAKGGSKIAAAAFRNTGGNREFTSGYDEIRAKLGMPLRGRSVMPGPHQAVLRAESAAGAVAGGIKRVRRLFGRGPVEKWNKGVIIPIKLKPTVLSAPPKKTIADKAYERLGLKHFGSRNLPKPQPPLLGLKPTGRRGQLSMEANRQVGKMFDWELGDIRIPHKGPRQAYDRYGNELIYKPVKPKPKPDVPTAKPATGLRAIEAPKKMKAISDRMAPKPAANIRLVHSRPEQLGDRPRLKLPDYMRHLKVVKVDTTMSEADAKRLAARYDTRGPLPKTLTREQRMKAYEARYIASGGKQGEKWKRRADLAETGRNIGLAGATAGAGITLAARTKRAAPYLRKVKITHHRADNAALASGTFGGASELYGEHARSRRASYQNSPAGVARSALSRMQAYTPEKKR